MNDKYYIRLYCKKGGMYATHLGQGVMAWVLSAAHAQQFTFDEVNHHMEKLKTRKNATKYIVHKVGE